MLDSIRLDLGYALRAMAHRPTLTMLAVLMLALGIGASASMFSVVDGVLLQPLPYPEPEQLMGVFVSIPEYRDHPTLGSFWNEARWEYEEFVAWRQRQQSFSAAALVASAAGNVTGLGEPERVRVGLAGVELFEMLGAAPAAGRFFTAADETENQKVTVISAGYWQQRLGGRADVVGTSFRLAGDLYTIVGVLPDGFSVGSTPVPVWIPIFDNRPGGFFPGNTGDINHVFDVLARLRPEVTPAMAQDETARLLEAVNDAEHFTRHGANVIPRHELVTGPSRPALLVLMGAVLVLLVIGCVNVATFLLGQAVERQQEIAIRGALGASARRIARQLLTESVVLGVAGGAVGLLLAGAGVRGLIALAPAGVPRMDSVSLDLRAAAFAVAASVLAGLVFGLAPALSLARADLAGKLGAARFGSRSRSRLQAAMVLVEISAATVLLVGAGLLTRSFLRLNSVDPGFQPEGVLTVMVSADDSGYRTPEGEFDDGAFRSYFEGLVSAAVAVPGVTGASLTELLPFSRSRANNGIQPEGYEPEEGEMPFAERRFVRPGYLSLMGVPLLEGRYLEPADDLPDAAPVVVVTENLARQFWPVGQAVGKRLGWWNQESTVVGVVGNIRDRGLTQPLEPHFYAPMAPHGQAGGSLVLKTDGDAAEVIASVRGAINRYDKELPIVAMLPMSTRIAESMVSSRFLTRLIALFAGVATLLSILGLYGVVARAVAARTREIGIRLALGAEQQRIVAAVLGDGMRLAALGCAVGLAVSVAGTRLLEGLLFGVQRNDPLTLGAIVAIVAAMSLGASVLPSLRASRVDPMVALRSD